MGDNSEPELEQLPQINFGNLTTEEKLAFDSFKEKCRAEGLLTDTNSKTEDDMSTGICDDGTLL
jgi:hypothetical protein